MKSTKTSMQMIHRRSEKIAIVISNPQNMTHNAVF